MADIITLQTETDLFGQEISDAPNIDREPLAAGLYAQMKDITLEEFVSYFTNGFEAIVDYANLCAGEKTGQRISLLFNPHRLDTGTKRFPISLYAALKDERFVRGLARVVLLNKKKGATKDLLYASVGMGVQGTSYVQEFPPHVARDLALEYNLTKSSHVLDPCAGWGGRMLGFSAVVNTYTCCEPSLRTAAGLRRLLTFIRSFRGEFNATIHDAPFEDVQLQNGLYDFAMTSPPYYDTEHYAPGEVANSFNRYATFESWVTGFYAPLIHHTMAALKPGACFVINIGSRIYPLNDQLFKIAEGRYAVEKQKGRLSASNGLGKDGEGETFYEVRRPSDSVVVLLDEATLTTAAPMTVSNQYTTATSQTLDVPRSDRQSTVPTSRAQQTPHNELSTPQTLPHRVSALDFALMEQTKSETAVSAPDVAAPAAVITAPVVPPTPAVVERDAAQLIVDLTTHGHHILTRDGKLFISNSIQLSEQDRADIKRHRDVLLIHATPWTPAPPQATSLAQFLGTEPRRSDPTWMAQSPPSLDNMHDIVLNFETNGLEWWNGHKPIGVTIGTLDGQFKQFLPFGFKGGGNLDEETVRRWAQRELRGKRITNAHMAFDVHMARVFGVDLEEQGNTVSDVQHYAALLDDHRKQFKLDVLAKDYLGGIEIERVDERNMSEYAAHDVAARAEYQATLVSQLREKMWPLLDKDDLQRVRQLEDDVIYAAVEMEKNAAPIDTELLAHDKAQCEAEYQRLLIEVSQEVGFAFAHKASDWKRVFEKYGLGFSDSYAEDVISAIDHPIVKLGHRAAQYASLNSKIFTPYTQRVGADGLLHYELNQLRGEKGGTVSGRFSAPYIHQVPNHDNHTAVFGDTLFSRRLFVPRAGLFFEADAAQIEFRIFAHHAENAKVLKAYAENPEVSFHRLLHSMILPFKEDLSYTHQKNLNFATIYAAGLIKTAVMMGFISSDVGEEIRAAKTQDTDPRLAAVREIRKIYNRELPEIDPLLKRASHLASPACDKWCNKSVMSRQLHRLYQHRGYVMTALGRRSRFPTAYDLHKALNRVLQGTAADIMKRKLVEVHNERKTTGFTMRYTVHDSVCGDVPDQESAQRVREILNRQSTPLRVPILWSCGTGANWADAKG